MANASQNNGRTGPRHRARIYPHFEPPVAGRPSNEEPTSSAALGATAAGLARFPARVDIQKSDVLELVKSHEKYIPPGENSGPILNLPEVDAVDLYCSSHEQQSQAPRFWEKEVDRLVAVVQGSNTPLEFNGQRNTRMTTKSLRMLSDVAEAVYYAIAISEMDNSVLLFQHFPKYWDKNRHEGIKSMLKTECEDNPPYFHTADYELCCHLIDFITATVARHATQSFSNEFLQLRVLAILAKISTKLKILVNRSKVNGQLRLDAAIEAVSAETMRKFLGASATGSQDEDGSYDGLAGNASRRSTDGINRRSGAAVSAFEALSEDDGGRKRLYFAELPLLRDDVFLIMRCAVGDLRGGLAPLGPPVDSFDITTLVYRTGFDQYPVLLAQDRNSEIIASSTTDVMHISHTAFLMLGQTVQCIEKDNTALDAAAITGDGTTETEVETDFGWSWDDEDPAYSAAFASSSSKFAVRSLGQFISLAVPQMLTQPLICRILMGIFIASSSINRRESSIQDLRKHRFTAQVSLKTRNFDGQHAKFAGDDAQPLSLSLMTNNFLVPLNSLSHKQQCSQAEWKERSPEDRNESLAKATRKFKELIDYIDGPNWTIDERAIIISCRWYVTCWCFICMVLVLGGLGVGFTVGSGIEGVDPFNITTFCWALAAFILVVVKSLRVENWPWRDFLRGRCVCRSVSELCSVTGLDAQTVLAYLLHNENSSILQTRGPFNTAFVNKADDGFSIDIKTELRTLLFSGIVLLKVSTYRGLRVCCLNMRKGTDYVPFTHSQAEDEEEWNLASLNYPNSLDKKSDIILSRTHQGWNKVLGIYNIHDRKFR